MSMNVFLVSVYNSTNFRAPYSMTVRNNKRVGTGTSLHILAVRRDNICRISLDKILSDIKLEIL